MFIITDLKQLPFVELDVTSDVTPTYLPSGDDAVSSGIPLPEGFPYGKDKQTVLYVSIAS